MTFGLFEASLGSETEVGMARQASADKLNTAVYDVREKLGPSLFVSRDVEEFRDRVAMMKNDQSIFKVIEASGLFPDTGTVRRIAGKNSILENEFKQRLATGGVPGIPQPPSIPAPGGTPLGTGVISPITPAGTGSSAGNMGIPSDPNGSSTGIGDGGAISPQSQSQLPSNPEGSSTGMGAGGVMSPKDTSQLLPVRSARSRRRGDFEGVQDIDSTFSKDEQGKELKPKDDWKGYLNSVDQDAPSKVKRNFASKEAWNLYLAWCTSNNRSAARLSSLDAYASNLSDVQYLKLANTLQAASDDDWGSDHHPKTPNTKLKKTDKVAKGEYADQRAHDVNWMTAEERNQHDAAPNAADLEKKQAVLRRYVAWCDRNGYSKVAKSTIDYYVSKVAGNPHPVGDPAWFRHEEGEGDPASYGPKGSGAPGGGIPLRGPLSPEQEAWMKKRGSRRQAALRKHLYAQVATTIRWARTQRVACWPGCHENEAHVKKVHRDKEARRRTAAPDYLQKADDALTQLLNQKAEEFQQTIQPLQQALQTVQMAEQLQQQANPMNVLPPAGTVNVMPGQGQPSTADQVGMPDPNAQDTSGLAALLSGVGGTAPNDAPAGGGQDAPPPAAAGGGLPPEMDPNQQPQQMAASRKRRRQARGVGEQFDAWKGKKTQQGDLLRGGDPDYEQFANETGVGERALTKLKQRNQTPDFAPINGVTVGSRKRAYDYPNDNGTSDDFNSPAAGHEYHDPAQQNGWKMTHSDDDGNASWSHPTGHSVTGRDGPTGGSWQLHGPKGPMGHPHRSPEDAQASMPSRSTNWSNQQGGGRGEPVPGGETDLHRNPRGANRGKARGAARPRRKAAPLPTGKHSIDDPDNSHEAILDPTSPYTGGSLMQDDVADLTPRAAMRKGAPFSGYEDFDDCTSKNSDKRDSSAYCGEIKHRTEDKTSRRKQVRQKTAWSGWGPAMFPKARKVAGWDWDDHLNGYLSDAPRIFTCGCGYEHKTPTGYQRCKCGKAYNSYVIGTGGTNKEAAAEKFLVREIPVREGIIVANRKRAVTVIQLVDPRTGNMHRLVDPGELDEGEDPGHSTFRQPPSDWAKRGDGAKWTKSPIG